MRLDRTLVGLLATSMILFATGCSAENGPSISRQEMTRLLNERMPIGTPKVEVVRFLSERKADFSEDRQTGEIQAMLRNIGGSSLVSTSLQLNFQFDSKGQLSSFSVLEKFTGP